MRYQIERFALFVFVVAARVIPRRLFLQLGKCFGFCAYWIDARHRNVARENLRMAFPQTPEKEISRTIRRCYEFFGMYLFDMLTLFRGLSKARAEQFEYAGLENVDRAYAAGKGAIFVTGHWGAWELMGVAHGYKGFAMGVVARRLDNPYLEKVLYNLRTCTGNFVIEKTEGFRPMLKALRAGKGIAVLIDQNVITDDRVFVDFFGKAAATTPAVALLTLRTGAAVVPSFAQPLPGDRYRFIYGEPIDVPLTGDRQQDVVTITQACTAAIEKQIAAYPEYWLWMHRRWKTRPAAEERATTAKLEEAAR